MKILLTAEARVLLNAGTIVDVEPATAETIIRLGKAVQYAEEQASEKPAEEAEKPEKAKEEAEKPAKPKGTKKK
jgi:hypothetical protein